MTGSFAGRPNNRLAILVTRGNDAAGGKPEDPGALKVFNYQNGKLTKEARDKIIASMSRTTDVGALSACDLVIEAIFEKLSAKRDLLQLLDAACSQDAIFASNTSSISIDRLAAAVSSPLPIGRRSPGRRI